MCSISPYLLDRIEFLAITKFENSVLLAYKKEFQLVNCMEMRELLENNEPYYTIFTVVQNGSPARTKKKQPVDVCTTPVYQKT